MRGKIRSLFLDGPSGRLEALVNEGDDDARYAAVVCHPHPLFGGTMHNKVVFQAMKAINAHGLPVLRFNFRGAGKSAGEHDHGRGEQEDVRAALDWLEREYRVPIVFCGFSFGAATGLRVGCGDARVMALISLGTPVSVDERHYRYEFLQDCAKPKLFVSSDHDQYAPRAELESVLEAVPEPRQVVFIPSRDHFFDGGLPQMRETVERWVGEAISNKR